MDPLEPVAPIPGEIATLLEAKTRHRAARGQERPLAGDGKEVRDVFSQLVELRDLGGGYFGCPDNHHNRAIFARNRIPPVRGTLGGKPILNIHRVNAEREAR